MSPNHPEHEPVATSPEADRPTGTRRTLLRGATLLSAAAIAGPFTAGCSNTAEQG